MSILSDLKDLTIYTGSNGRKGCTLKCMGCSQEKYGRSSKFYQGTIEQFRTILDNAPNLEDVIILGNPDPSVDATFCNNITRILTERGITVRFSMSGYNAYETVRILLKDIKPINIKYLSFSIDTLNEELMKRLKSKIIDFQDLEKAINYCQNLSIPIKVQPTLWKCNQNEYREIINYFVERGVDWFSFHVGSFETFEEVPKELKHITPGDWRNIFKDIKQICQEQNLKVHMPYLFLYEDEWRDYIKIKGTHCNVSQLKKVQIWMEENYVRATNCALLREAYDFEYEYFNKEKAKIDTKLIKDCFCPVAEKCIGKELCKESKDGDGNIFFDNSGEKLYTVCRFYNYNSYV